MRLRSCRWDRLDFFVLGALSAFAEPTKDCFTVARRVSFLSSSHRLQRLEQPL